MSIAIIHEIEVDTGGSNIQFSLNPENGDVIVIDMNPRVSRSSALESKCTGFPISKLAPKLSIGLALPELSNFITRETPACFEPSLDYVVTKVRRFQIEKFSGTVETLSRQMRAVGEVMAIGRTFLESFHKALRILETGRFGWEIDGKDKKVETSGEMIQFGGQTPLKLAVALEEYLESDEAKLAGAKTHILGTSPDSNDAAEDRDRFMAILEELEIRQPANGIARSYEEAAEIATNIAYPVVVRPSYVLGGRGPDSLDLTDLEDFCQRK